MRSMSETGRSLIRLNTSLPRTSSGSYTRSVPVSRAILSSTRSRDSPRKSYVIRSPGSVWAPAGMDKAPASPIKHMIYLRIDNLTSVDSEAVCGSGVVEPCHRTDVIQQRFRIRYLTIITGKCFVCHLPVFQIDIKIKPAFNLSEDLLQ